MTLLPRPTVLLLHRVAENDHHVDWLLARDREGRDPLITFRLDRSLTEVEPGQQLPADRLDDHRPDYLHYEGPVSGDRGTVERLASGRITACEPDGDGWRLEVSWADVPHRQRLRVIPEGSGPRWRIEVGSGVVEGPPAV